jgi:hypothetical protein
VIFNQIVIQEWIWLGRLGMVLHVEPLVTRDASGSTLFSARSWMTA